VLGLGAAKQGAGHWWSQRLTSVALVALGIWLLASLWALHGFDYDTVIRWIRHPIDATLLTLFVIVSAYHSQLGMQVVIEDYVQGAFKTISIVLSNFLHVAIGALGVIAVLRIAFGGAA